MIIIRQYGKPDQTIHSVFKLCIFFKKLLEVLKANTYSVYIHIENEILVIELLNAWNKEG